MVQGTYQKTCGLHRCMLWLTCRRFLAHHSRYGNAKEAHPEVGGVRILERPDCRKGALDPRSNRIDVSNGLLDALGAQILPKRAALGRVQPAAAGCQPLGSLLAGGLQPARARCSLADALLRGAINIIQGLGLQPHQSLHVACTV